MGALAQQKPRQEPKGSPTPRVAPPTPARSAVKDFAATAEDCGFSLYPWQETAARYLTATGAGGHWLYPEVATIVSRQNGKTHLLIPLIVSRLLAGRRIMHTAQNRELPREVFGDVADHMWGKHRGLLRRKPRFANGQEEIRLTNGGHYRIVAPTRGGARGPSNDDLIIDELREMDSTEFIAAAEPTLTASANPQVIYLSNAGTEDSTVLNALRKRADEDPALAYLEWSAGPELADDDRAGWRQANPAIGHNAGMLAYLERKYQSYRLAETMGIFETEHLCRWVITVKPTILGLAAWEAARAATGRVRRPVMGIALDPSSTRASAAIAWQETDGAFGLEVVADVTGDPIDLDRFGPDLRAQAAKLGVAKVVFDPYDEHLARHFLKPIPMNGRDFANACGSFVRLIEGGRLRWQTETTELVGTDLPWTTKRHVGPNAWMAVRANEERPITAMLAAIRAVGAAYRPASSVPRIM
jgi:hypothetical protein